MNQNLTDSVSRQQVIGDILVLHIRISNPFMVFHITQKAMKVTAVMMKTMKRIMMEKRITMVTMKSMVKREYSQQQTLRYST